MGQATNVTISKLFKGKSGKGDYGPWQAWDVYFEGSENKYSYFSGGKKPEPVKGMKVAFMEFDVKQKGEYTNRTITKMVISAASAPASVGPASAPEQKQAYIDHGKCVISLMTMAEGNPSRLLELIDIFRDGIDAMTAPVVDHSAPEEDGPPEDMFTGDPGMSDDDIPF